VAFTTAQITALETQDIAALSMEQVFAFATDDIAAMTAAQVDALLAATPIMLDLDGDGVQTVSAFNGVRFDINATGEEQRIGWISRTDGLLAMDHNGDGLINDGSELFGAATRLPSGERAGDGFAAMATQDSNGDGLLDASDANWSRLRVWVDANFDAHTDAGELHTLDELGIRSLNLTAERSGVLNHGNLVGLTSTYTTDDGAQHEMSDVWIARRLPAAQLTAMNEMLLEPPASPLPEADPAPAVIDKAEVEATLEIVSKTASLDEELGSQLPLL